MIQYASILFVNNTFMKTNFGKFFNQIMIIWISCSISIALKQLRLIIEEIEDVEMKIKKHLFPKINDIKYWTSEI